MANLLKWPLLFGAVRHCRLIGEDPRHKALCARNEERLAALKAANRLYEVKSEPATHKYAALGNAAAHFQRHADWNSQLANAGLDAAYGHEVRSAFNSFIRGDSSYFRSEQ